MVMWDERVSQAPQTYHPLIGPLHMENRFSPQAQSLVIDRPLSDLQVNTRWTNVTSRALVSNDSNEVKLPKCRHGVFLK